MRHVAQHREAVPEAFAATIDTAAHHKAADYTIAKLRLGHWDMALDTAMLVMWTLLGGLGLLDQWLLNLLGPSMWQQISLVVSFILISAVVSLPLSYIQTFKIEQAFGFNRMTLGLWLTDMLESQFAGCRVGSAPAVVGALPDAIGWRMVVDDCLGCAGGLSVVCDVVSAQRHHAAFQ